MFGNKFRPARLGLAVVAALSCAVAAPAVAAEKNKTDSSELLRQLSERIEKLEKANAELNSRLNTSGGSGDLGMRVKTLEEHHEALENALDRDNLSEKDPQLATRLKATEAQTLGMQKAIAAVEALDGIKAGVSFTTVAQRANHGVQADGSGSSELNYRGDVAVSLPGGSLGEAEGKLFAQVRLGQGTGLGSSDNRFSPLNASAFQLNGVSQQDDSVALLAQAWYQLNMPLFRDQTRQDAVHHLSVTFGKIDPYLFFDQNAAANDETRQFLNSVFVHNALLDAAHDTGVDAYGYAPGVIAAYTNEVNKPVTFGLSAGVFAAGAGAQYNRSFRSPFVILQAETRQKLFDGLDGNYRAYVWRSGLSEDFDKAVSEHKGWGVNLDQRIGDALTVFARVGNETRGRAQFDQTLTGGVEIGGNYWGRSADALGIALGSQRTSRDFRNESATLDADGDGQPDFGYQAQGSEQVLELYYRYRVHKQFELSPDFQYLRHPGGNRELPGVKAIGLRAQVTF